jgi:hypothetical protein
VENVGHIQAWVRAKKEPTEARGDVKEWGPEKGPYFVKVNRYGECGKVVA